MLNVFQLSNYLRHYDAHLECTQSINFKIHVIHYRTFITLQLTQSQRGQRGWCEWCLGTRRHQLSIGDKQIVSHQAPNGGCGALTKSQEVMI